MCVLPVYSMQKNQGSRCVAALKTSLESLFFVTSQGPKFKCQESETRPDRSLCSFGQSLEQENLNVLFLLKYSLLKYKQHFRQALRTGLNPLC